MERIQELSDCQKTQSALQAIIAWIKVLQLEKTQSDSSSIGASFLCQVLISQLESLKTAGVFHVAEKDGSGILNYVNKLTTQYVMLESVNEFVDCFYSSILFHFFCMQFQ
jgi:hypothetical protein